jgi:hypothetical protein
VSVYVFREKIIVFSLLSEEEEEGGASCNLHKTVGPPLRYIQNHGETEITA